VSPWAGVLVVVVVLVVLAMGKCYLRTVRLWVTVKGIVNGGRRTISG
jgi:hypothetical protein